MTWVSLAKEYVHNYPMRAISLLEVTKMTQKLISKIWVKDLLIKSKDISEDICIKKLLSSTLLDIVWVGSLQGLVSNI